MTLRARRLLTLLGNPSYRQKLLNTQPANLIFAPFMNEASGTVMTDYSSTAAHGTYAGSPTLAQSGIGDGGSSVLFDGTTDRVDLDVITLDGPFDPTLGTIMIWFKVRAASVWTDGVSRILFELGADASNRIYFNKPTVNNRFDMVYIAGGTSKQSANTSFSPATWTHAAITWNKAADQVKFFINGAQVGATLTGLGVWTGALADSFSAIGNFTSAGGAFFYDGYLAYPFVWNTVLTPAEIASIVPPAFLLN